MNNFDTVIIKKGDKYYFTSGDNVYELNDKTISRLKLRLSLPAKVLFRDCPFDFIGSVISGLFDESVDMNVTRIKDTNNYEVLFSKTKEKGLY